MIAGRVLTPGLIASEAVLLRRTRELPVTGTVTVLPGQHVNASDIVAFASLPGDLVILKIPEKMGLEPFEVLGGLKVREGDEVGADSVLCEHRGLFGLFSTTFRSPYDGRIEFISHQTAHVGLRLSSRRVDLDAYLSGKVASIEEGKSVTIECTAAFVQGIFGVGGERQGILTMLNASPGERIEERHLPADMRGRVLVGGTCPSGNILRKAQEQGAVGFITASIEGESIGEFLGYDRGIAITGNEDISMSVLVTEGFGNLAFSDKALSVLRKFEGKKTSLNGTTQVRAGAQRPEVVIAHEAGVQMDAAEIEATRSLVSGCRVRAIRVPFFGETGTVVDLPAEPYRLDSGTLARVAVLQLDSGNRAVVPRTNIELI